MLRASNLSTFNICTNILGKKAFVVHILTKYTYVDSYYEASRKVFFKAIKA